MEKVPHRRRFLGSGQLVLGLGLALGGAVAVAGCATTIGSQSSRHGVPVPSYAKLYSTKAGGDGVRGSGSAADAERLLKTKLAARGDEAEPDAALAATAAWALERAYSKANLDDANLLADAAQRFGFAGMVQGFFVVPLADEADRQLTERMFAGIPGNVPVNRYGIMGGHGTDVAVLVGNVEVSLDDFPRSLAPGADLRLAGEVSKRFQRASVFSTDPAGKVSEIPGQTRKIDATISLPTAGIYSLEIMGYGKPGPVVLLNVPIFVGVSEGNAATSEGDTNTPFNADEAAATMLALLNEERKKHGARPVEPDAELRELALAHSLDMDEHGFVGHVSPTTGGPDDRVRRARVRVSKAGECVALAPSPAGAHRGLLASPAHRVIMLEPSFNHVGIGAVVGTDETGRPKLHVTLLLGRRVPVEEIRQTPETLIEAIQGYRKARKLPKLRVDGALMTVAGAGSRALETGRAKTPEQALSVSAAELQRVVNRSKSSRVVCQTFNEIIERGQISTLELLNQPELGAIGVGLAELADDKGPRLGVMIAGEAAPGKALKCE